MEQSEGGEQSQQQPQPWGKLIRLGADEAEHVLLLKREWTIGRRKGCDLSFPGNKLVSGDHCKIIVDEESGQVSLEDTSTNGTIINKLKVVKKQTYPLQTGDVIYVVYRKNEPENNVAYLYESLNTKHDATQETVEVNIENQCHETKDTSSTGRSNDETQITSSLSATQSCYEEPQPSTSTSNLFNASSTSLVESASVQQDNPSTSDEDTCPNLSPAAPSECIIKIGSEDAKASNLKPDKMEETLTCIICQELLHDCVRVQIVLGVPLSGSLNLVLLPDKCRNEDDVRSMDARNKITQDMLQPKVRRSFSDEEGSSEDLLELSDVDSESSDISQPYIVCRQCPGYRRHSVPAVSGTGQETEAGGMQVLGDAPSTSANFPAEINLGDKCLDGVLNNNHYESDILKDYLASRGLTWKNMLNESLLALQRGVFMLSDYRITGNTVLCYCCGLRSFRELAYQYRQNIPVAELPVTVTSRPDCYWGRNCRTQVKAHHAMKFNHICEQTRFKN
ncbi:checkpoint with forkhead and ring finger [Turdus rufiventris]|nr:checkpoint with forkhead and ring finger [Turdus rufiventris]